jgi:trimeric autotransporter adhesin
MRVVLMLPLLLVSTLASAQPAVLDVAPGRLAFIAAAGGRGTAPQRVTVRATGGTPSWRAVPSAPWLRVSPASGTMPGEFAVSIDAVRLSAGSHAGRVTVSAIEGAGIVPVIIDISVQIAAPSVASAAPPPVTVPPQTIMRPLAAPDAPGASTPRLELAAPSGSTRAVESTVTLDSPSPGPTEWFAKTDTHWLTVSPITGLTPTRVTVRANPSGLGDGPQTAVLRFVDDAGDPMLVVPVTLTIGESGAGGAVATPPSASAAHGAAATRAPAGAAATTEDATLRIEPLSITVDALPSVTRNLPYSQTIPIRGGTPPYIFRLVDGRLPLGLTIANGAVVGTTRFPGIYALVISVADSSVPPLVSTKPLVLRVVIAYQNTALTVTPASVSLLATAGQPLQSARVGVESGAQPLAWTADGDKPWLRLSPAGGVAPTFLQVGVDARALARGTHVGTITITMDGAPNSPLRIPVQVLVRR